MVLFIVIEGEASSGGPYLLWTWVFSAKGLKTLKNRGVLDGFQPFDYTKNSTYQESGEMATEISGEVDARIEFPPASETRPPIRFCRKCGFELIVGSSFCSRCGTPVVEE